MVQAWAPSSSRVNRELVAACWALAWAYRVLLPEGAASSHRLATLAGRLQGLWLHRALQADIQVSCPVGNSLFVG